MKTSHIILGIMGAATAGVALGVLFATEKGSKIRKKMRRNSKDYRDEIRNELLKIANAVDASGEVKKQIQNQHSL